MSSLNGHTPTGNTNKTRRDDQAAYDKKGSSVVSITIPQPSSILAFDGKQNVTCSKDITIRVWDRNTGELVNQLHGHTGSCQRCAVAGGTRSSLSRSEDFSVKLWNIDSGEIRSRILETTLRVSTVASSRRTASISNW
ncbi:hypothetical protein F4778DRAFT_737482 [Xylariomycetidae sp. FL2044]|nr:hypothetical protein F4778DRAFT_737482 [Xylariomycetidae sp. FL2044]